MQGFFLAVRTELRVALMAVSALPQEKSQRSEKIKRSAPTVRPVAAGEDRAWGRLSYVRHHFVRAQRSFQKTSTVTGRRSLRTVGRSSFTLRASSSGICDSENWEGPPDDVSEFADALKSFKR